MSILFHKDYPYSDLDNCYKNYELLIDSQQWVNHPLVDTPDHPIKRKATRLIRQMNRCFPRGKAYMRVSKREFMAGN
ncbi:hypothetical protein [Providencia rettgeri]|uniref:hypothetical protein n=1 Tax=Providencia rettgeri TaxID=587 RepID=UPI00118307AB|nr:hypothetical protein [Providencia rettgeri]